MEKKLSGKKIAILVTDGFEQEELTRPRKALEDAGAKTFIIAPHTGKLKGWDHTNWGQEFDVALSLSDADPGDYDALFLPGGVMNADKLRMDPEAVRFARAFFRDNKPVAAICHAPWLLIEADVVEDRHLTSYESLKTDLQNAGAHWENSEVVVDGQLVTSRKPQDIPAFNEHMISVFAKEKATQQA
jgi:protease I